MQFGTCTTGPLLGARCGVDSDCGTGGACTSPIYRAGAGSAAVAVGTSTAMASSIWRL